jgi:hypothetical protein
VTTAILMSGWRIRLTNGMAIPPNSALSLITSGGHSHNPDSLWG